MTRRLWVFIWKLLLRNKNITTGQLKSSHLWYIEACILVWYGTIVKWNRHWIRIDAETDTEYVWTLKQTLNMCERWNRPLIREDVNRTYSWKPRILVHTYAENKRLDVSRCPLNLSSNCAVTMWGLWPRFQLLYKIKYHHTYYIIDNLVRYLHTVWNNTLNISTIVMCTVRFLFTL